MSDQYVPALRPRFLEDRQIKGLQQKPQTMYLRGMRDFTRFQDHAPDSATPEKLRAFQLDMKERSVGPPTFNNRLAVLSFFFATTCPRPVMKRHMRYQRVAKKIPAVLSAKEVARIFETAPGLGRRYRATFSAAYGGGLRANEVTHLKVGDIDNDPMLIRVDLGKGRRQGSTCHAVSKPVGPVAQLLPRGPPKGLALSRSQPGRSDLVAAVQSGFRGRL